MTPITDLAPTSLARRQTTLGLMGLGLALGAAGLVLPGPAQAQFRVEISGVGATQIPLALGKFKDRKSVV